MSSVSCRRHVQCPRHWFRSKKGCASPFLKQTGNMNIELQNRTFLFCFGKDFSSYRQNSCCCDTADIPRHPSNVHCLYNFRYLMILMHDWLPMVQNAAGLRAYKKHERMKVCLCCEKSRLSLHVLSSFAASSQSCPKWLATAF